VFVFADRFLTRPRYARFAPALSVILRPSVLRFFEFFA
jgi:hypothetical protein